MQVASNMLQVGRGFAAGVALWLNNRKCGQIHFEVKKFSILNNNISVKDR